MGSCISSNSSTRKTVREELHVLPVEIERLLDKWTMSQILLIQKRFMRFAVPGSVEVDLRGFRSLFGDLGVSMPPSVLGRVFARFDSASTGYISFRDTCLGLASACLSAWDTRARFVFDVFDLDADGILGPEELESMLSAVVLAVRKANSNGDFSVQVDTAAFHGNHMHVLGVPRMPPNLDRIESCVTAMQSEAQSVDLDNLSTPSVSDTHLEPLSDAERIWMTEQITKMTREGTLESVTFSGSFLPWSRTSSQYLHKFLELLELVPSPAKERLVCLGFLRRSTLVAGSSWYIVSYKWMQIWKAYVHWSEADSIGTVWDHSIGSPTTTAVYQGSLVSDSFGVLQTMSAVDMVSCTSTVIQQRMSERPNAVDNSDLEGELKGALRYNVVEHHDYLLVPEEMWKHLMEWYGGGPAFPRKVVVARVRKLSSMITGSARAPPTNTVDLYPPLITVLLCGKDGYPVKQFMKRFFVARTDSCEELIGQLCSKLLNDDKTELCRLWHRQNGLDWEMLARDDPRRIDDFVDPVLTDAGTFMLERRDLSTDSWPRDQIEDLPPFSQYDAEPALVMHALQIGDRVDANGSSGWKAATIVDVSEGSVKVHFDGEKYKFDAWLTCVHDQIAPLGTHDNMEAMEVDAVDMTSFTCNLFGSRHGAKALTKPRLNRRVTGLENIGNTCFMNAIIQCVSRTPMMREYFLANEYKNHIRPHAKVAGEFASLLSAMWNSSTESYAPRAFKKAIEKYAPRFAGYEHQDAHELLAVLLDALHEDLNRGMESTVKPSLPPPENAVPLDPIVAGESEWKKHKTVNSSIISDLFDGQHRIMTTCASCLYETSNFETFRYVLLPVPITDRRTVVVHFMPLATANNPLPKVQRLSVTVHKNAPVQAVLMSLPSQYPSVTKQFNVEWENDSVILAEVYMSRIHRLIDISTPVHEFRSDDLLYIFQITSGDSRSSLIHVRSVASIDDSGVISHENTYGYLHPELVNGLGTASFVQLFHRREVVSKRRRNKTVSRMEIFGTPIVLSADGKWSHTQIWNAVRCQLCRFMHDVSSRDAYVLRYVGADGTTCASCNSPDCQGCAIDEFSPHLLPAKNGWTYIAVDWVDSSKCSFDASIMEHPQAASQGDESDDGVDGSTGPVSASLYECMDSYLTPESLTGDNQWLCDKCKMKSDAERKFCWWVLPDVLVILLKRFQYTNAGYEKVNVPIKFPLKGLTVKTCRPSEVCGSHTYDLYGVVNHYGTLSNGHYTAICQEENTSDWCLYNDHQVSPISSVDMTKEVLENSARTCYVLFYKRNGARPANLINYGVMPPKIE